TAFHATTIDLARILPPLWPFSSLHTSGWISALSRLTGLLLLGIALGAGATWAYQAGLHRPSPAAESPTADATGVSSRRELAAKRSVFALGTLELRGGPVLIASSLTGTEIRQVL